MVGHQFVDRWGRRPGPGRQDSGVLRGLGNLARDDAGIDRICGVEWAVQRGFGVCGAVTVGGALGDRGVPDDVASKETCALDDLRLSVRPGAPTFRDGQQPNFFLEVTNPTSGECDIDLSEDELKFEVFTMDSGYSRVWGDTDCNSPTSSGRLRLDPDQSRTFEMTAWSRTTSSPDSCDNREPVGNGAYMVYGHIGDNTSESQTFNLA